MFRNIALLAGLFASVVVTNTLAQAPESAPSGPVSRKPPTLFKEKLADLLTPLDTVLAREKDFPVKDRDGVILLDEDLIYTDEAGTRVMVHHVVEKALNESGVASLAEDTHSYRTLDQRIHLVLARTILPDGKELPVANEAAFLESPQSGAADSVYGDRGQLRVIYSGMRPGAIRESIVVVEETAARIPGHFSASMYWAAYWPMRLSRTVVLMPQSVADRLKVTNLGAGVPAPESAPWAAGWRRMTWARERITAQPYEAAAPPATQTGPVTMVTTLPDWDTFGAWYRGLLEQRSELPRHLRELAHEWTRDARSAKEKLAAVVSHVSRDVRYTGLEFGLGALQPRSAEEIWRTGYGDCKDKSNLAVLLLRELGIPAYLVLLQTEHAGLIDKRCPDHRHFDHAIFVAEVDGEKVFTDPTIRYGKPGMLGAASSDRDVLIIKPASVEWSRTPPFAEAGVHYELDAEMQADGSVEGWLHMSASGYFRSYYQAYYETLSRDETQRELQDLLSSLLPGSRLIDAKNTAATGDERLWSSFFALPAQEADEQNRRSLHFPAGPLVMLSMEDKETRETARFLWPMKWQVSGKIKLPSGWQVQEMPAAYNLHTAPYEVNAAWSVKDGVCSPSYEAKVTRSLLQPAAHSAVWRGSQALTSWLRKPLRLVRGETAAPIADGTPDLQKMPLMPTGQGQLELVDLRYPPNGNRSIRRAALRQVIDYFPDDPPTTFTARVRLALLDWNEEKPEIALRGLQDLLASPSPKVDDETVAWAQYMKGVVLRDMDRHAEALKEFQPLAERESLSPYRRAFACLQGGLCLTDLKENESALQMIRKGLALEDSDSVSSLILQSAVLAYELKRPEELKKDVDELVDRMREAAAPALVKLAQIAGAWAEEGQPDRSKNVLELLENLPDSVRGEEVREAVAEARKAVAAAGSSVDLQKQLRDYLSNQPDHPILKAPPEGWPQNVETAVKAFEKADQLQDSDLASRLGMHLITAFPPDGQFGGRLWRTAVHIEHLERSQKPPQISPLLAFLLELGIKLPKRDDHHFEMRFLEARTHEHRFQDWKKAGEIYGSLVADEDMPESFRASAITRLGNCREELEDYEGAAEALSKLVAVKQYASAGDGLARAAHLRLEAGKVDEALRLLRVVATSRNFALEHSQMPQVLAEFLDVAADEKEARKRWETEPAWWPHWKKLEKLFGIEERPTEPMIQDLEAAGSAMARAVQAKDAASAGKIARQLAHGARWHPGRVIDMAWISVFQLSRLHPARGPDLLEFVVTLLNDFKPATDDQQRARLMYLAMCQIDRDQHLQGLEQIHEYFEKFPPDEHQITFAMARLWGAIAMKVEEEREKAAAALRHALASPALRTDRVLTLRHLADLYHASGKSEEEIKVLREGLSHPQIAADPQQVSALKERLEQATVGSAYAGAVKRWLSKFGPGWLQAAQPRNLSDLGEPEEIEDALEKGEERWPTTRYLKACLLAASEAPADVDQIDHWWANAMHLLILLHPTQPDDLRARMDAILEDSDAPDSFKETSIRIAYLHVADAENAELLKHWRKKIPASLLSDFTRDRMEAADAVLAADFSNPKAAGDLVRQWWRKRNPNLLEFLVSKLSDRAAMFGSADSLEAIADVLNAVRKEAGADAAGLQSLRLQIVRSLAKVRRLLPVQEALAGVVLKHPLAQPGPGAKTNRCIGADFDAAMTSRQYLNWMHEELLKGKRPCRDLGAWFTYTSACSTLEEPSWELRRQLIEAMTSGARDDETRSEVVGLAAAAADLDSPSERDVLFSAFETWRDLEAMPQTQAQLRLLKARVSLRTGKQPDLASLNKIKDEHLSEMVMEVRLKAALLSQSKALAAATLDEMGPDGILEWDNLRDVVRALRLTGRTDELELVMEEAEEKLHDRMIESWTGRHAMAAMSAIDLALMLEKPELLPPAWRRFICESYPDRHDHLVLKMNLARLEKNWAMALEAASEAIEKFPTYYSNYWVHAEALSNLGRKSEALPSLRTYLQYCHDEAEYPTAQALLQDAAQ
jgi:tetratricopeptide (TPR) repeat protein